jgi:predicted nucleic acid-binding Zn ribbon protein
VNKDREKNWEMIWRRVGAVVVVLLVIVVAGPQVIDLFVPDFR